MVKDDRNIPDEAVGGRRWNNRLPPWIRSDPAYQRLRQGPRHTLQVIADRCTAPPCVETGEVIATPPPLLVCFGGKRLIAECGCHAATFRRHKNELTRRGFIVRLSGGSSRLADVYGIPGHRGELDPYSAGRGERRGTGPGGRWTHPDTRQLLLLVSHNATLAGDAEPKAEPSQNATPGVAKRAARGSKTRALGVQNAPLPSSLPSSSTSAHKPSSLRREKARAPQDDDAGRKPPDPDTDRLTDELSISLPDSAGPDRVKTILRKYGVDRGRAHNLASNRYVTPALIRDVLAKAVPRLSTIENPGGYIGTLMEDAIARAREAEREREAQAFEAEQQRLADAEASIDTMPDAELQEVIESIEALRGLSPAEVRANRVFRHRLAGYLSQREVAVP